MVHVDGEETVFEGDLSLITYEILIAVFDVKKIFCELKDFEGLDYINRVLWESAFTNTVEELLENLKRYEDFKKGYSKKE